MYDQKHSYLFYAHCEFSMFYDLYVHLLDI